MGISPLAVGHLVEPPEGRAALRILPDVRRRGAVSEPARPTAGFPRRFPLRRGAAGPNGLSKGPSVCRRADVKTVARAAEETRGCDGYPRAPGRPEQGRQKRSRPGRPGGAARLGAEA